MRRRIILVCVLLGTVMASLFLVKVFVPSPVILTSTSPNKTRMIRLTGNQNSPSFPIIEHVVRFDMFRNGEVVLTTKHLYSGDWWDAGFTSIYPEHKWVNESVIRFSQNNGVVEEKADSLLIRNDTDMTIRYLRVRAKDMFLLFDLQPNSTIELMASPQTSLSYVSVDGEFQDGASVSWNGVNFQIEESSSPVQYLISISSSETLIERAQ